MSDDPIQGGGHAARLARGAVLFQVAQVLRLLGGVVVGTLLARTFSLSEFGTYTIVLSLLQYVTFLKASVTNAALLGVAQADGDPERVTVVASTGLGVYSVIGIISGLVLTAIGLLALPILNIPEALYDSARQGVLALAVAVMLSWPAQIFDDVLRGLQRFTLVAALEIGSILVYVAGAVALVVVFDSPVWALVGWNASIPLLSGLACAVALRRRGLGVVVNLRGARRVEAKRFGQVSGIIALGGVADLVTYSFDRAILSAFRSPATVGLYEGPLNTQNMVRMFNGVMTSTVLPASTAFLASGDLLRVRELFVRGLKYSLAALVPFVVVIVVMPGAVLEAWLGAKFTPAAVATGAFCSLWLVAANSSMASLLLYSAGRLRLITAIQWLVAVINLGLALVLTPRYGLDGTIAATMTGLLVSTLLSFTIALRQFEVPLAAVARRAWLPAYSTGVLVAGVLAVAHTLLHVHGLLPVALAGGLSLLLYWALYAWWWLDPSERRLARTTLGR